MTDRPPSAKQRLVLASTSPYRRELLARLIQDFDVIPPDIDESSLPAERPVDLSARLARQKALAVVSERRRVALGIGQNFIGLHVWRESEIL